MKDLSIYVIEEIKKINISSLSISELKILIREITKKWWDKSSDYSLTVKKNFKELAGHNLDEYENDFINNLADHYAEKIYISIDVSRIKKHVNKIKIDKSVFDEIIYNNKTKNKNVLLLTCHFGGVELIPTTLTLNDISAAVFVNYKTSTAKQGQIKNAIDIGLEIFSIGDNLSRKIIYLRKNPKTTMLVCDAFEYWKRGEANNKTKIFGKSFSPDQGIDRLIGLLDADVYFGYIKRINMEEYDFVIKKINPVDNKYIISALKEMEQLLIKYPEEYYAWHDIDQLFKIKAGLNV